MTARPVRFADAEGLVVAHLVAAFAERADYSPTVSTAFPAKSLGDGVFHLQVEAEPGDVTGYPVTERVPVRVTAHGHRLRRSGVKDLASTAFALLCAHEGNADVSGVFPAVGRSDVVTDPDTKNLMVWTLARLHLKPRPLAS